MGDRVTFIAGRRAERMLGLWAWSQRQHQSHWSAERKGPQTDLPFPEISGVRGGRRCRLAQGQRGRRGVSRGYPLFPGPGSGPPPALSIPRPRAGLYYIGTFQSGAPCQIAEFALNSGLPASLENPELRHPGPKPQPVSSAVRAAALSQHVCQDRPVASLTGEQAEPHGISFLHWALVSPFLAPKSLKRFSHTHLY